MAKSSFFSGTGTTPTNVESVASSKAAAEASENAAAASAAAAAQSATQAETSNTDSNTAKVAAQAAQAAAETAETNSAASAASAATSLAGIGNSETNAATSASESAASAAAAAASASSASSSATSAAADAASAATSLSNIGSAEANAAASATSAASSASTASTDATSASASQVAAAASESAAATSEANSATSETNAATSASQAATSAANSATSETNAATSASSASTSASNAASSASAASASQVAAAASAASAANAYDTFDDRYLGSKTADPTVDNDGNALVQGSLYFNSISNEMRVYDGVSWIAASSAGGASLLEYKYTATAAQTTFSGADDNANTLSYTQDNLIVTLNGVVLENGADYTATNGTSVVLASGAAASDELNVIAFKSFTTADMVPASTGGTFYGNVAINGDLTVDTNTLYVDSTNNRVGIGTSSLSFPLSVQANSNAEGLLILGRSSDDIGEIAFRENDNSTALGELQYRQDHAIFRHRVGDLRFATGGTSERMRITSSGSVGIGDTSPYTWSSVQPSLNLRGTSASFPNRSGALIFKSQSGTHMTVMDFETGNDLRWYQSSNSGSSWDERMRIDASGSLLLGQTSANSFNLTSGFGFDVRQTYGLGVAVQDNPPAIFNRTNTDGDIVHFRKNGSTVGSIGVSGGNNVYFSSGASNHGGLIFSDGGASTPQMNPLSSGSTLADGVMNIGSSSYRFKDGYFSGTVNATSFVGDGSSLTGVGGSTTQGAVGTYTWGRPANATDYAPGDTASSLYAVGLSATTYFNTSSGWVGSGSSFRHLQSGTWRSMNGAGSDGSSGYCNLWVRIS